MSRYDHRNQFPVFTAAGSKPAQKKIRPFWPIFRKIVALVFLGFVAFELVLIWNMFR